MKRLLGVWGFLVVCLLAAGSVSIVFAIMFQRPGQLIMNLIVSKMDGNIGIALGITYLLTVLLAIPAILQPPANRTLLKVLNWWLVGLAIETVILGSIVWFFSLRQRSEFSVIWDQQSATIQQALQDTFSCCGYWNGTASGQFTVQQGFCADATFAANQTGCVTPITASTAPGSDFTLNNIFTSIYGFEAIIVALFMATSCVINERQVQVRFERIDAKRGGGGFV
ncbi:hypothetical protein M231_03567 [Tremella mesenterica]|uniref:Tetraspanin n=1 Tax=Tremella mesenterica TaxID=5217 RepID=A0A4Q1BN74_TREME|nr:uncharacterized protein TREMEDRAFT_27931 [Tremella mesenterica DSM 1558]EIW71037.1 hypothetical protein TREMEDRAFT_27931 [Tremella mesenterica DSM 1558]RXK39210.1 hypothetical protein M231_03567 [Tremella mesenterica]